MNCSALAFKHTIKIKKHKRIIEKVFTYKYYWKSCLFFMVHGLCCKEGRLTFVIYNHNSATQTKNESKFWFDYELAASPLHMLIDWRRRDTCPGQGTWRISQQLNMCASVRGKRSSPGGWCESCWNTTGEDTLLRLETKFKSLISSTAVFVQLTAFRCGF